MRGSVSLTWRRFPERYRLEGSKCLTCGTYYFPPRKICPKCRRKGKIEKVKLSGKGEIYSLTTVYTPPTGFEEEVPYVIAIVKLEEGPMVLGQIVDAKEEELKIGDKVEMVFRRIMEDGEEGLIYYGYKFRKID